MDAFNRDRPDFEATEAVTGRHDRGVSALEVAEERWGSALPALSGGELAWALRRAGFEATLDGPEHVLLLTDHLPVVRVPLHGDDKLHPVMVMAILRTLGVTPAELMGYLFGPEE